MNKMMKIIIACLMLIIIFSIGSVSAEEIVDSDFTDVSQISGEVAAVEDNQIINDVNQEIVYSNYSNNEKSQVPISSGEVGENLRENLLGLSLDEENALQYGKIIPFSGDHFRDLRDAIEKAEDGDTIDLEGKTIIADSIGGNSKLTTHKHLTFINGVINSANVTTITAEMRSEFYNCIFENVTFINYREAYKYGMIISDCELRHVTFQNFTVNVAGFVVRRCNLTDVNFTECHSLLEEDEDDYETGAMIVAYNSNFDNCNFVNCTTNRHSGAICIAGENGNAVNITNSNFINCRAGIGGAIYVHGNEAINENFHSNIINCTFINNTATERGGAIGSSQNYLVVENCLFENNTAKRGSAYMLAGIDHGLDGIPEGHYNSIINSTFKNNVGTEEGGAVHITGNNNKAINCTFLDNYATEGNGSAIYVHGNNSSVIDSEFYHHECSRGTVYIIGDNTIIDTSIFENNTASRGGAGVYVDGNNTLISNSIFNNNSAVYHGGALHSHGDNLTITNSNFTSNTAIASTDDVEQGLGGAIYIKGDNSDISFSFFENNVARNGSAIYNRGQNLTIEDDTFIENQAWSYLITGITNNKRFYYDPEGNVTIDVTHRGGDNIINAIYNDGSPDNIFFKNVTYELSVNNKTNSGPDLVNPVDGVEKSEGGTLVYQDSREDNQNITIIVTHIETGKVVINVTSKTGILGNLTVSEKGLLPGNYSVNVTHFEDGLYKFITNMTYFEILPVADLAVEKLVSNKTCNLGDEIIWTIKVTNNGPNNVTDAYVIDKLPDGLIFNGTNGKYDETTGKWDIGKLNVGDVKILEIKTIVNITNTTFVNVATINSSTYDPNKTNNVANNTTKSDVLSDLRVVKLVSQKISVIGDKITWTIKVTNNGPDTAVNAYAIDVLPSDLSYVSDDSNGKYNSTNGRWDIGDLKKGASATLNIVTKITNDMTTIVNNVFVNSSTPDSNMSNNNASNDTRVLESNFIVEKNTITPLVSVGEQVKFQIVVRNTGLTNLTNVFVEEFSYDGLEFDHALNQSHWTHSIVDGKNRWTLKDILAINQVTVLTVVFNTTKVGNFTNVVVAGSNETENKTAKNDTEVVKPEFSVEKITITPLVSLGDQVIFEIIVKNTGLVNLTNVFVEEFEYDGLIFDHANTEGFWVESVVDGKTRWTYDFAFAPGVTHGFTVVFNTTGVGNFTNVVVAGSDNSDNKTTNNTTTVVKPQLSVEKITVTPLVILGEQVIFEIIVKNTGLVNLTNVFVEEFEYDGLIFDHANTEGFWVESVVGGKTRWTYDFSFAPGVTHGFTVVFNTTGVGNFTNVVVAGSDNSDNKTTNNTTTVVKPEFTVEKISLNPLVSVGEQVTFEIVVTNTGAVDLTNVVVSEIIPDGLVFDHAYGLGHWMEIGNYSWVFNNVLAVNEAHGFFIVFNTTKAGNFTNTVVVKTDNSENKTAKNNTTVVNPEFTVEKISLDPIVPLNNLTSFEIIVRNVGQTELTGIFIEETDYESLTYVTFINNGVWNYNYDSNNPRWELISSLRPHQVVTLTVIFNATAIGNWTNTVTAGGEKVENKTANNITHVYDDVPFDPEENATNPNLSIEKIALDKIVAVGDEVTFEIVVTNTGDKRLNDVTVHEKFDDGLKFINFYDLSGLWIYKDDLTFTYNATLHKGETAVFYVVFESNKTGNLANVVTVTSNETDNKTSNDTVEVLEPKLEVNKVAINKTVAVGNQVIFEILVRNTGRIALNNVIVEEKSFEGLTYSGWYDDTGLWTKNIDLSWSLKSRLEPSEYIGFFVVFNTTETGKFTNLIVVNSREVPNKTANDTVTVLKPDYTIEKFTVNRVIPLGDTAYFEIIIRNTGEVTLRNFTVYESFFDDGLVYDAWYDDTGLWSKNGDLSWTFNSYLSPGVVTGFFVAFNTTKVGSFDNVVTLTSDSIPNKTANDTIDVVKPEFSVEKITVNRTVVAGDQVIFEIIVNNYGNIALTNLTVYETEFDGLEYAGWFDYTGKWIKNSDLSWTYNSTLEAKKTADFYIVFNTTNIGNFTNVIVAKSDSSDNKSANNTTDVIGADLSVIKLVSNENPIFGEEIIWTIIVTNKGPATAKGVYVKDVLPNGLIFNGADGDYDVQSGIWNIGDLAYNATAVLNIKTLVNITNVTVLNVAVVNSSTPDSNKSNNIANNTTNPHYPSLNVTKNTLTPVAYLGEQVVFEIIVRNTGDCDLTGIFVEEIFPEYLIYAGFDGPGWSKEGNVFSYGGILAIDDVARFTITFTTTRLGNFTNAVVAGADRTENKTTNNNTTVVEPVADLSVIKLVSNSNPNYGDVVVWTIIVNNNGPDTAKGVFVVDILPYGLLYQSSNPTIGSYDSITGIWTICELSSKSSASLEIVTLVNITNASIFNIATVNSTTSDPNPDNNKANNTTNVNPAADLSIEKVVLATDGQKVTWAIIVTNNGPDTAINTRAIDVLSNLLILLSYNASKGLFDSAAGVWTIGNMENGEVAILIIETIVNGTGTIVNEARVISDTYDPNMTNNYDFDYVVVEVVPDVEPPVVPQKSSDATPATGNPLIMLLMALIALGTGTLRRRK